MKIIHLAKYYSPHVGGVEIHIKEINSLLVKMGHEVTVFAMRHDLKLSDSATYNGVNVYRVSNDIINERSLKYKLQVWNFIKHHKQDFLNADIVHVHDVFWWTIPIIKDIWKKTFITFHGWETEYPVRLSAKIQRYIYSKISRGSIHIGDWIQNYYFDKPTFITYGAINGKRLTKSGSGLVDKASDVENYISNKIINIAYIGRLSNDNDVKKYIKVVEILKSKGNKVNIIWVGDGEFSNECRKHGEVTGFVKNISKYFVNKDFVFASSYLSILEAQLVGCSVCSFYSNDLKKSYLESFPGSKYLFIANKPQSMIKKITYLLSSPKLQAQSRIEAKQFAKEQTWEKVLALYLKLWRKANE